MKYARIVLSASSRIEQLTPINFVIFHAIRVSGNQDYSGMMDQAVDNGRCHRKVLKDISHLEMRILVVKMLECTFCLSRCQLEDEAD